MHKITSEVVKLELWWLGLATPKQVYALNKKAIGTDYLSKPDCNVLPHGESDVLNEVLRRIWLSEKNGKRKAHLVAGYFSSMRSVFEGFQKIFLQKDKYLCLITGNNTICEVEIPNFQILTDIGEQTDFKLVKLYRDEIKARVLFKNRNHNGGVIKMGSGFKKILACFVVFC